MPRANGPAVPTWTKQLPALPSKSSLITGSTIKEAWEPEKKGLADSGQSIHHGSSSAGAHLLLTPLLCSALLSCRRTGFIAVSAPGMFAPSCAAFPPAGGERDAPSPGNRHQHLGGGCPGAPHALPACLGEGRARLLSTLSKFLGFGKLIS